MLAGIVIGMPTFRLRGHYFALSMLAYPLAMLYVFEWLGYQEVSLPMKREAPALYAQFNDQRAYMALALALMVVCMIVSLHVERSRFGMSLLAIKQNEPAAEAAGINALRWKMLRHHAERGDGRGRRRALCRRPAGRYAADHVRRAGLGAGADRRAVRRRRRVLGAGDRRRRAGAARRDAERRAGPYRSGHPGRRLRRRHHRSSSLLAPEGIYWRIRDRFAVAARRGACRRRRPQAPWRQRGRRAGRSNPAPGAQLAKPCCVSTAYRAPSAALRPSTTSP